MFPLFFFNDTATTEIYTLSLHDALPICPAHAAGKSVRHAEVAANRTNVNGGASIAKRRAARNHQEFPQRRQRTDDVFHDAITEVAAGVIALDVERQGGDGGTSS